MIGSFAGTVIGSFVHKGIECGVIGVGKIGFVDEYGTALV